MYLFEFPQNALGYLAFLFFARIQKRPWMKYQDAFVVHIPGNWGALTLSRYIFADDLLYGSRVIQHEYGHRMQSRLLKILYLPVVGIPSLLWAGYFRFSRRIHTKSYYSFYTEVWANKLAEIDLV